MVLSLSGESKYSRTGKRPVQFLLRVVAAQNRDAEFVSREERIVVGDLDDFAGQGEIFEQDFGLLAQMAVFGAEQREGGRHGGL